MSPQSLMAWLTKSAAVTTPPIRDESGPQEPALPTLSLPDDDKKQPSIIHPLPGPEYGKILQTTSKPSTPALPPNVELRACTKEDIKSLKLLTSLLLQIPYQDKFFREILDDEITNNITLLSLWHDDPSTKGRVKGRLVGAIRCRLLHPGPMLYLSTLVLLSPYRGHGIAAQMLDVLTIRAARDYGVASIGAHVWEANEEGLEWYRKRGFMEVGRESGYYRRLEPMGAVFMERKVGVMDLIER